MATIIRSADPPHARTVALNFNDLSEQADRYMASVKAEAAKILAEARQEAETIRQTAAERGAEAAVQAVEEMVTEQMAPALTALQQAAAEAQHARQEWLTQWEANAVHLASAIAARIIRGELRRQPDISLRLVREALELAAGSPGMRLHLNPADHQTLAAHLAALTGAMSGLGNVELVSDETITLGGCRLETRFGTIDQQIESQLKRIEEELTG